MQGVMPPSFLDAYAALFKASPVMEDPNTVRW